MHLRRRVAGLAALVALGTLAACGDDDPAPGPTTDPAPSPTASFDPSALDLGRLDPTRTDVRAALSPELAERVASYQLGEHLVLPTEVDERMLLANIDSGAAVTPEQLSFMLPGDVTPVTGSTAAIFSRRSTPDYEDFISTGLLAFPDADQAEVAAAGMHQLALTPVPGDLAPDPKEAGDVPGREHARAAVGVTGSTTSFIAFEASGPFLMYVWVYREGDVAEAQDLARDFLDDQEQRLADVEPVQVDAAPTRRSIDPEGQWGLTLAPDTAGTLLPEAYRAGSRASRIRQVDTTGLAEAYQDAGLEEVTTNAAVVYRTDEDEGPDALLETFVAQADDAGMVAADPPQGLDDGVCRATEDEVDVLGPWPSYICWVAVDQYLAEAAGRTIDEARQVVSAQVVLLHTAGEGQRRSRDRRAGG